MRGDNFHLDGYVASAFIRPGFEEVGFVSSHKRRLRTKRVGELVNLDAMQTHLHAGPRIATVDNPDPNGSLADLEHAVLGDVVASDSRAAYSTRGWAEGAYYLTDLSQRISGFRHGSKQTTRVSAAG